MADATTRAQATTVDPDQWNSSPFEKARRGLTHYMHRTGRERDIIVQLRNLHADNDNPPLADTKVIRSLLEEDAALMSDPNWPTFFLFPVPRWTCPKAFDFDHAKAILQDKVLGYRLGYAVQTLVTLKEKKKRCPILEEGADPERTKEIWQSLSIFDYILRLQGTERVMLDSRNQNPALELCSKAIYLWFDAHRGEREQEVKEFFHGDYEAEEDAGKDDEKIRETPFYRGMMAAQGHHAAYFAQQE